MKSTSIICDKCGAVGMTSSGFKSVPVHILRTALKSKGWRFVGYHAQDICPACSQIKNRLDSTNENQLVQEFTFSKISSI